MSLESQLDRLVAAVEIIAAHVTGQEIKKPGPGRPAKPAATAPDLTQTAGTTAVVAVATAAAETVVGPTIKQLQDAITAGITAGKRDQVIAVLGEFGAKNASTVKPADYTAVKSKLDDLALAS